MNRKASSHELAAELDAAHSRIAELEHELDHISELFTRAANHRLGPHHTMFTPHQGFFADISRTTAVQMQYYVKRWERLLKTRFSHSQQQGCVCQWTPGDSPCPVHMSTT